MLSADLLTEKLPSVEAKREQQILRHLMNEYVLPARAVDSHPTKVV